MNRLWQWTWDRYGRRYSWAFWVVGSLLYLPVYVSYSTVIVATENSDRFDLVALITAVALAVMLYVTVLPGVRWSRPVERWAAGVRSIG